MSNSFLSFHSVTKIEVGDIETQGGHSKCHLYLIRRITLHTENGKIEIDAFADSLDTDLRTGEERLVAQ